jgi:hypothetical protein
LGISFATASSFETTAVTPTAHTGRLMFQPWDGSFRWLHEKRTAWIGIVRPPVLAIAFVLKILYTGLLGWWLTRIVLNE